MLNKWDLKGTPIYRKEAFWEPLLTNESGFERLLYHWFSARTLYNCRLQSAPSIPSSPNLNP